MDTEARITDDICAAARAGHDWRASGMFLVRSLAVRGDFGEITPTRQLTAGPCERESERTPEVEVCAICGLLRIRPAT